MSQYGNRVKEFIAGGEEYTIYQAENGVYSIVWWEEINYDEYEDRLIAQYVDWAKVENRMLKLIEAGLEFEMNI